MMGYKIYFDYPVGRFKAEVSLSESSPQPEDSTVAWFKTRDTAERVTFFRNCDIYNSKLEVIVCKSCGRLFMLYEDTRRWYTKRGWEPPVRCKTCRDKRKKM